MPDYTIKNLRDVDDSAKEFGFAPAMSARFAREDLGANDTGISLQALQPGERQPFGHSHGTAEEVYVVLSGSGAIKLDDEELEVTVLDAIRIAPGVNRAMSAGPDGLEWLAVGPVVKGDAEMDPDIWSD